MILILILLVNGPDNLFCCLVRVSVLQHLLTEQGRDKRPFRNIFKALNFYYRKFQYGLQEFSVHVHCIPVSN